MRFGDLRAAIFDMDGVLWRGDEALPGLHMLFDWLAEWDGGYALATNNSSKTPADYVAKLARLGVEGVPEDLIFTSGTATAATMQARYPAGTRVYVLGMDGLRRTLDAAGFDVAQDAPIGEVQVVVAGVDFALSYESLKRAALHIRAGADYIGTNPDLTFPSPEGLVPGAGAMLAALEAATDVQPMVIGKPHAPMFQAALAKLGVEPSQAMMVGDRLNTDIEGGVNAGMKTVLLFTGVTRPEDLMESATQPDVAYEHLGELVRAWAGNNFWIEWRKAHRGR